MGKEVPCCDNEKKKDGDGGTIQEEGTKSVASLALKHMKKDQKQQKKGGGEREEEGDDGGKAFNHPGVHTRKPS